MSAQPKTIYKVLFHNQNKLYELYAHEVTQSDMYAFIEVADIIFGERTQMVVDPSEEWLKTEFGQVQRTYIPLHSVVRIDRVTKRGVSKIIPLHDAPATGGAAPPIPPPKSSA